MTTQTVHDPVCHMDITIEEAVGSSQYQGETYYFCAPGCKQDFDDDPAGILSAEAAYDHSQSMNASSKKPWWRFW